MSSDAFIYARGDVGEYLVPYPELTQAQADAIAEAAATLHPSQRLAILQTSTDSGGTHTYVRLPDDHIHVARNGNVVSLGGP